MNGMSGQKITENSIVLVIHGKAIQGLPFFFPAVVTEVLPENNFIVRTDNGARVLKVSADMLVKIGDFEDLGMPMGDSEDSGMSASDFFNSNKPRVIAILALEVHNQRRRMRKKTVHPA